MRDNRNSDEPGSQNISSEDDERKRKLELRLTRTQYLLGLLALVHVVAFVVGALLGFGYLLRHQFNPGGISGSDTLAMVVWSFGFLVTLALGLGVATVAGFPAARVVHLIVTGCIKILRWFNRGDSFQRSKFWWSVHHGWPNRLKWRQDQWFLMFAGCFGLIFFAWLIVVLPYEVGMFFVTMLTTGMFLSLVVFGKIVESYAPLPRRHDVHPIDIRMRRMTVAKRSLVVAAIVVASTTVLNLGMWLDASAALIGFREQDVSVRLAKDDFDELIEQATRRGITVNPCEQISAGSSVLRHVDILWQNLGARSLLRFPSQPLGTSSGADSAIRLTTMSGAMTSVVSGGGPFRCQEFLADTLFWEGGEQLRRSGSVRIVEQLRWLSNRPAGWKVRVVAHSSQGAGATEAGRTLRQALAVKSLLETMLKPAVGGVEAVGADKTVPKLECTTRSTVQRALCEKANRRVEVYLYNPG